MDEINPLRRSLEEYCTAQITIAKHIRGYNVRKTLLPLDVFKKATQYFCDADLGSEPRAMHGFTPVYFSKTEPVVYKVCGRKKAIDRFYRAQIVRDVVHKKNLKALCIPKGRLFNEGLIEEKILFPFFRQKECLGLYMDYLEFFEKASEDFTNLLCHFDIPDILTPTHPYRDELALELPRYDNLLFFIKDQRGFIGLVDLEECQIRIEKNSDQMAFIAKTALNIFPFHFEQVKKTIESFFEMPLPPVFEDIAKQIASLFHSVYLEHKIFLESKIYLDSPIPSLSSCIGKDIIKQINESKISWPLASPLTISQIQKRTLQIPIEELSLDIKEESLDLLKQELETLKNSHFIHYFNFYSNREKKICVVIHF